MAQRWLRDWGAGPALGDRPFCTAHRQLGLQVLNLSLAGASAAQPWGGVTESAGMGRKPLRFPRVPT